MGLLSQLSHCIAVKSAQCRIPHICVSPSSPIAKRIPLSVYLADIKDRYEFSRDHQGHRVPVHDGKSIHNRESSFFDFPFFPINNFRLFNSQIEINENLFPFESCGIFFS